MVGNTREYELRVLRTVDLKRKLTTIYDALKEKGYNPINQLVGYILSEDPTYITTYKDARKLINGVDRDELLQVMLEEFLDIKPEK